MDLVSHKGMTETRKFKLSKLPYKGTAIVSNWLWLVSKLVSEMVFVEVGVDILLYFNFIYYRIQSI